MQFVAYSQFNVRRPTDNLKDYYTEFTNRIELGGFDKFYESTFADIVAAEHRSLEFESFFLNFLRKLIRLLT